MEKSKQKMSVNPREKANIFSILTFWWTIALFRKGYQKPLVQDDLFRPLKDDRSQSLGDRLEKQWTARKSQIKSRTRLIRAIGRTFWWEITRLGMIQVFNEVFIRLGQPLLLGRLLESFRNGTDETRDEALLCAGGIVILNALSVVTINQFTLGGFHLGMKIRVAVCSIIYRKALRLSRIALGDTAPGKVVNLLSNDVNRFDMLSIFLHFMWSSPLMALVVTYLLYNEIGLPGVVGVAVVFLVVPIQSYTGKLSSRFRLQTALKTDERVRLMDEVISGVQVIKMYAWEKPYSLLVAIARKLELKKVRKSSYVRGLYMTFMLFTTRMALFCTMLAIVLGNGQLTASKVFVVSSYFNILAMTMSQMFVRGFAELAEGWVATNRLQNFLDYDEFKTQISVLSTLVDEKALSDDKKLNGNGSTFDMNLKNKMNVIGDQKSGNGDGENVVKLTNVIASWTNDTESESTLNSVTMEVPKGKLIGIIGGVGSGKSSLLQLILGELPISTGDITVSGKASYACQEPWVFASSVRQNILFGQPFEKARYNDVIRCCALQRDFEQLPDGDLTIVGERGASLSGGQRARVSLARAVYRRADLYLLDDPLSAVDAHVGRHLFDRCIGPKGQLSGCTRVLVTHQVHYLKDADWIVVMNNGSIEAQGTPKDLSKSGIDIAELIRKVEENEESKQDPYTRRLSKTSAKSKVSMSSVGSHESDSEQEMDADAGPQAVAEASSKGTVQGSVFVQYFKAGANIAVLATLLTLFVLTQVAASAADYWVSFWTAQEELRHFYNTSDGAISYDVLSDLAAALNTTEDVFESTTIFSTIRSNALDDLLSTETCIYIHGGIVASLFIIAITRSLAFYTICVKASQTLHNTMFQGIIGTTMRFFDTNPSGRIMNRFSKDMGAIDEYLPKALLDATQIIFTIIGSIILTATVNAWFLVPIAVLAVVFVFVRRVYLKTSMNIKRLEGITRSPAFSHLAASLAGLSTVRAFGAQNELIKEFDTHQDMHTAAWYMFITTSTAFGFSLDVMCLFFVGIVTFSFLIAGQERLGDQVGLAITQAMALTGIMQWGIRQSAEAANQMMSVERVLEYKSLPPESEPDVPREPPAEWPEKGVIKFNDMSLSYIVGDEPVLKNLDIEFKEKEKVGIVGRTGAGKSSLITAIFRLAPMEGSILIDGVDTATITLNKLRSKVSIIPQDPVLFSGTLRRNLDPFEEYPDSSIWTALHEVELGELAGPLGLQAAVMAGGSNFSVGQRQLLCLARAILRENKILVLDEATANVDPQTDILIQRTIRSRFADCTVLTVAHRLHTVMDSDRVLVMDAGQAAEFARPDILLDIPDGIFRSMVEQTAGGRQELEYLTAIAKEAAQRKRAE